MGAYARQKKKSIWTRVPFLHIWEGGHCIPRLSVTCRRPVHFSCHSSSVSRVIVIIIIAQPQTGGWGLGRDREPESPIKNKWRIGVQNGHKRGKRGMTWDPPSWTFWYRLVSQYDLQWGHKGVFFGERLFFFFLPWSILAMFMHRGRACIYVC